MSSRTAGTTQRNPVMNTPPKKKPKPKRISGAEDTIEIIDTTVKEYEKMQNVPNEKNLENPGHNKHTRILQNSK